MRLGGFEFATLVFVPRVRSMKSALGTPVDGNGRMGDLKKCAEVSNLLALARDRSDAGRRELATLIGELFSDDGTSFSDKERALILQILEKTIQDIEHTVRALISSRLSQRDDVPESLLLFLANDNDDVAFPILKESGVLKDEVLIEIIRTRSQEHQIAISLRSGIPADVSQALVETGNERVIVSLLKNDNASISQATFEYLAEESKRMDTFQDPLLRRKDLPPVIAQRMFMWVSAALRRVIAENFDVSDDMIDMVLEQTAMELYSSAVVESKFDDKAKKLAEALIKEGSVDSNFLLKVLTCGEVQLFVTLLSKISGVRRGLVLKLSIEPQGEGLAVIIKALGLDKTVYASLFGLLKRTQMESEESFKTHIRTALKFYDSFSVKTAKHVMRRWRLNEDYLSALRTLEPEKV